MNRRHLNHFLLVASLVLAVFVITSIFTTPDPVGREIHSLESWQLADTPAGFPRGVGEDTKGSIPGFDHRFILLDAFERFEIPQARRLSAPMGSEVAGLTYNAQRFGEDNPGRGGAHTGDDLNGIGGMNSDLGDPVFAAGSGRVLYAGLPSPGWGNTVILGHRLPDGRNLHSMYAHLDRIDVIAGALVGRGDVIGTVGTAGGRYPAHLHFEIRESDSIDLGAGYTRFETNHLDPAGTVAAYQVQDPTRLSVSPLTVVRKAALEENFNQLILENAHLLPELRED